MTHPKLLNLQRIFHMLHAIPPRGLPGVGKILGIAAGKGGVGKSTVAFTLARAMAHLGVSVGLLDGDIHGPSVPTLLGVHDKPATTPDGKTLMPVTALGIRAMSMGFLVPEGKAAIWRGPMMHQALDQLLFRVDWGTLAYLIVDLPPGTGDIPLSLAQKISMEILMVTTSQALALQDVRRSIQMFQKMNVPMVGILENMAFLSCERCHHSTALWGESVVAQEARTHGLPFLGQIPWDSHYQTPASQTHSSQMSASQPQASSPLDPHSPFLTLARHLLKN